MDWKIKMAYLVESVLNDDMDSRAYELEFLDDNTFQITMWGERVLDTQVLPPYLCAHWKDYAKRAVVLITELKYQKYVQAV